MTVQRRRRADKRTAVAIALIVVAFCVGLYRVEDTRKDADHKIAVQTRETAKRLAEDRAVADANLKAASDANCRKIARIVQVGTVILKEAGASKRTLTTWRSADCKEP